LNWAALRKSVGHGVATIGGRVAGLVGGERYVAQKMDDLIPLLEAAGFDSRGGRISGEGAAQTLTAGQSVNQLVGYQYAAMRVFCGKCIATEMHVERRQTGKEGKQVWEEDEENEITTLLGQVNEFMTWPQLKDLTVGYLYATGSAFWYLKQGMGGIDSIWPLPSQNMVAKFNKNAMPGDPDAFLTHWQFSMRTSGGVRKISFDPDEIVHLSIPSPINQRMGFGPLMAAGGGVNLLRKVIDAQYWGMQNGLVPSAIVRLRVDSPQMLQTWVEAIQQKFEGAKRTGKIIGLPTDAEGKGGEWQQLGRSAAEMGYKESEQQARDLLLGGVGVPQSLLGITRDTAKANVEGAEFIFSSYQIAPLLTHLDASMTQDLCQRHYGPEFRIRHDSPIPDNLDSELKEVAARLAGGDVWNAIAAEKGWPQHPWGDVWWTSMGMQPISDATETPAEAPERAPEDTQTLGTILEAVALPEPVTQAVPKGFTPTQRRRIERAAAKIQAKFYKSFAGVMTKHFRGVKAEVLGAWDKAFGEAQQLQTPAEVAEINHIIDATMDVDKTAKELHAQTRPFMARGMVLGGEFQRELFDASLPPFSMRIPAAQKYAREWSPNYWAGPAHNAQREIKGLVARGIRERLTLGEIRGSLVTKFDSWMGEGRALLTARTESTKMFNAGSQAFREEYQVTWKQWICSFVHSRKSHITADGQVRKNDADFSIGADSMPFPGMGSEGGENCNCNCNAIAIPEPRSSK